MASAWYISNTDGSSKTYFDYDPVPLPRRQRQRVLSEVSIIPGVNASDVWQPSKRVVTDMGGDISLESMTLNLSNTDKTTLVALEAKFDNQITNTNYVLWDADDGLGWNVLMSRLSSERIKGHLSRFNVTITLEILSTV